MKPIKAWWFAASRKLSHGDDRLIRRGATHVHRGKLVMCSSGLHASRQILNALSHAPGTLLCRVECSGEIVEDTDKLVCSRRTYLAVIESEEMLFRFARLCALDVIHLWDAPEVVQRYLRTGDPNLRDAARAASWLVTTAGDPARVAARDGARAARVAANATQDGARTARAAAQATIDAAQATIRAVPNATMEAFWAATEAGWVKQNRRLTRMANYLIREQ